MDAWSTRSKSHSDRPHGLLGLVEGGRVMEFPVPCSGSRSQGSGDDEPLGAFNNMSLHGFICQKQTDPAMQAWE